MGILDDKGVRAESRQGVFIKRVFTDVREARSEGGGQSLQLEVHQEGGDDLSAGMFVQLMSRDANKEHDPFRRLLGQRVKVTVEVLKPFRVRLRKITNATWRGSEYVTATYFVVGFDHIVVSKTSMNGWVATDTKTGKEIVAANTYSDVLALLSEWFEKEGLS